MREKNGFDKRIFNNFGNPFKEPKLSEISQKIVDFNKNASKCENFCWKEGELHSKIYWCKKIDKSCIFTNCPKNNKEGVNN